MYQHPLSRHIIALKILYMEIIDRHRLIKNHDLIGLDRYVFSRLQFGKVTLLQTPGRYPSLVFDPERSLRSLLRSLRLLRCPFCQRR